MTRRLTSLKRPDAATWQAIAKAYNAARLNQLGVLVPACSPDGLEQWLLQCAKAVREFLHPPLVLGRCTYAGARL